MAVLKLIFSLLLMPYGIICLIFSIIDLVFGPVQEDAPRKRRPSAPRRAVRGSSAPVQAKESAADPESPLDGIDTSGMSRQDRELLLMLKDAQAGGNVNVTVSRPKHLKP